MDLRNKRIENPNAIERTEGTDLNPKNEREKQEEKESAYQTASLVSLVSLLFLFFFFEVKPSKRKKIERGVLVWFSLTIYLLSVWETVKVEVAKTE